MSTDSQTTTDGFHLVIDALKLNGIDTIFGLPGIPITDLTRMAQAEGLRVISFRHEQHAGNAAAAAGFLTQKPGICLTVSAPGFHIVGLDAVNLERLGQKLPDSEARTKRMNRVLEDEGHVAPQQMAGAAIHRQYVAALEMDRATHLLGQTGDGARQRGLA